MTQSSQPTQQVGDFLNTKQLVNIRNGTPVSGRVKMQFSKMHGLGNDFMVVDAVTQNAYFSPELICRLANRHTGVGFDQLLVVEAPYDPELDFHYRIFNADGSEVAQCGNGARCFARFVRLKGLQIKEK